MAISPPSDLILDVAKAADPAGLKEATSRLRSIGAGGSGEGFSLAFQGASNRVSSADNSFRTAGSEVASKARSPGEKFEAMILTQFVETMLPDDAEMVFGKGSAGEIWKSMLAEQVATQLAASGGVGIADIIKDSLNQATVEHGEKA
ncbi:rod-binding protein [Roseibium sp. Sym1]|uniref:rod-binding protein n=1 Tax=Roseibium sp. Sym1 TaxID=3016006 RepID=UPI0022B4CDEC|nr:rod-binding protein [Roseibium sp. Sym1]